IFSNTFSSFLLDPGALFFGTVSLFLWDRGLEGNRLSAAFGAGLLMALAVLYKGMAVAGFVPAFVVAGLWTARFSGPKPVGVLALLFALGLGGVLIGYVALLAGSH